MRMTTGARRRPGVGQVLGPALGPEAEELVGDRGLLLGLEIRQRLQPRDLRPGQLECGTRPARCGRDSSWGYPLRGILPASDRFLAFDDTKEPSLSPCSPSASSRRRRPSAPRGGAITSTPMRPRGRPAFFDFVVLGTPARANWIVVQDHNPPSAPNQLTQVVRERPADSLAVAHPARRDAPGRKGLGISEEAGGTRGRRPPA